MTRPEDCDDESGSEPLPVTCDTGGVSAAIDTDGSTPKCTLFPTDADAEALVTQWISASDDAFVGLDEMQ